MSEISKSYESRKQAMANLLQRQSDLQAEKNSKRLELLNTMADTGKSAPELSKRIAEIDVELETMETAIELAGRRLQTVELKYKAEKATDLADRMMKYFEDNLLDGLRSELRKRFEWRQQASIKYLTGEDTYAFQNDPAANIKSANLQGIAKMYDDIISGSIRAI